MAYLTYIYNIINPYSTGDLNSSEKSFDFKLAFNTFNNRINNFRSLYIRQVLQCVEYYVLDELYRKAYWNIDKYFLGK